MEEQELKPMSNLKVLVPKLMNTASQTQSTVKVHKNPRYDQGRQSAMMLGGFRDIFVFMLDLQG